MSHQRTKHFQTVEKSAAREYETAKQAVKDADTGSYDHTTTAAVIAAHRQCNDTHRAWVVARHYSYLQGGTK